MSVPERNLERLGLTVVVTSRLGPAIAVFDTARCPAPGPRACRSPSAAASRPAPDDVDLVLLEGAQACLARLRAGIAPGAAALEAWNAFFAAFDPLVRRTVLGCPLPPADVEDCVQEGWIEIVEKLPAFRFDARRGRFQGWLHRLVRRKTLKWRRRLDAAGRADPAGPELGALPCGRFPEPSAACQDREALERFSAALAEFRQQVPPLTFRVLELVSLEERPMAEIAERLKLTRQQIWKLHHRAKTALRRFLDHRDEEFLKKSENSSNLLEGARDSSGKGDWDPDVVG